MNKRRLSEDDSATNIGIIGSKILIDQIKETLKSFPNFTPVFYILKHPNDISVSIKKIMNNVEVLLFTEYHYYQITKKTIDFTIPIHHIPLMSTGLYRALFMIKHNYHLKSLSIDIVEDRYVEQILLELESKDCKLHTYNSVNTLNYTDLVKFHIDNYHNYHTIALTGVYEVYKQLGALKIPCEWVIPTQQDMIVSLERALLATETRKNKESQIVFGLVNIDDFRKKSSKYTSEHDIQLLKLNIQQMLLDYIKSLDGHLINLGGDEYSFITTRGIFERETRGYKFIPLLKDVKTEFGVTLSLGIGFGSTAAKAGNHARMALSQSKDSGGNVGYIVREDRSVLGPVDITTQKQYERYDLSVTDPLLLEKADKAGMSATYMTKIMARVARHRKIDYTAQELSTTLSVTVRSAHRILLKLMDAELVEIIGEEKVSQKGRPRRIYRLKFIEDEHLT